MEKEKQDLSFLHFPVYVVFGGILNRSLPVSLLFLLLQ